MKDNAILPYEEESNATNVDESSSIMKKFIALQNKLVWLNSKNQQCIKNFIKEIKSNSIKGTTAAQSDMVLSKIGEYDTSIGANLTKMHDSLEKMKN
jgi:hypothetical protein